MTDDLVTWLRAQLDEDERVARAATPGPWAALDGGVMSLEDESWPVASTETSRERADRVHIARHDPARVLRDVAAERAIVDAHPNVNDGDCGTCVRGRWGYPTHGGSDPVLWPCETLRHLASTYAGRPGYREEWAPELTEPEAPSHGRP